MKPLTLCLLAALTLQASATAVRACQYCRMAADDPEMARLAAEMHAKTGGFPLDGAINKFQAAAPAATLTTPPSTASVTTQAADLPSTRLPTARRVPPPSVPVVAPTVAKAPAKDTTNRWANGGLLGLLGLAGFFGWRTRRAPDGAS